MIHTHGGAKIQILLCYLFAILVLTLVFLIMLGKHKIHRHLQESVYILPY